MTDARHTGSTYIRGGMAGFIHFSSERRFEVPQPNLELGAVGVEHLAASVHTRLGGLAALHLSKLPSHMPRMSGNLPSSSIFPNYSVPLAENTT